MTHAPCEKVSIARDFGISGSLHRARATIRNLGTWKCDTRLRTMPRTTTRRWSFRPRNRISPPQSSSPRGTSGVDLHHAGIQQTEVRLAAHDHGAGEGPSQEFERPQAHHRKLRPVQPEVLGPILGRRAHHYSLPPTPPPSGDNGNSAIGDTAQKMDPAEIARDDPTRPAAIDLD